MYVAFDPAIPPLGIYLKAVIVDGKKLETFVMSTIGDWLNKLRFKKKKIHGVAKSIMFRNHPDVIDTTKPSWNVVRWGVVRLGQSGAHLLYLKNSNSNFKKYCTTSSVMHQEVFKNYIYI